LRDFLWRRHTKNHNTTDCPQKFGRTMTVSALFLRVNEWLTQKMAFSLMVKVGE
jgi:hypothetical protein